MIWDNIKRYCWSHWIALNLERRYIGSRFARTLFLIAFLAMCFTILHAKLFLVFHSRIDGSNNDTIISTTKATFARKRVDILDRNGMLLARNVASYDLYLKPSAMFDIDGDLEKLVAIFPTIAQRKEKILNSINNKINDPKQIVLVIQNILDKKKEEVINSGIIGLHFEENQRRVYSQDNIAAHLVGFLIDDSGAIGIERSFDSYLKNTTNQPLELSIDINIQSLVHHAMIDAIHKYEANAATGLIMNVKTGEILAAVSLPDFDPNNLSHLKQDNLLNRFSMGVYELGSVFKIFLAALAAERNIPWNKRYNTINPLIIGHHTIRDFSGILPRETMNIVDIIKYSSNIGCGHIMIDVGVDAQKELFSKLGLTSKLDIEISEAGSPIVPHRWKMTQAITISYGHGIAVTPLHFITAASAIINGGVIKPTFLKINDVTDIKYGNDVISRKSSIMVKDLLRTVVLSGSGKKGAAEKYDVGGKSGTAIQVVDGKYHRRNVIISFFAAIPIGEPEYAFYITLHSPRITNANNLRTTGGSIVAPIISNIISLIGPMLGVSMIK